jgi:hypothetical protein
MGRRLVWLPVAGAGIGQVHERGAAVLGLHGVKLVEGGRQDGLCLAVALQAHQPGSSVGGQLRWGARAFHGPGLLDLASWHGTTTAPDPQATAALITAYVQAGGHPAALDERAGLPPEQWVLGWHRIWAADWWYCEQLDLGWVTSNRHALYGKVITRHLIEAAYLLGA